MFGVEKNKTKVRLNPDDSEHIMIITCLRQKGWDEREIVK